MNTNAAWGKFTLRIIILECTALGKNLIEESLEERREEKEFIHYLMEHNKIYLDRVSKLKAHIMQSERLHPSEVDRIMGGDVER